MRKPNANSVLKSLPPDRQQEIYDYLHGTQNTPPHSLLDTKAWLAAAGTATSHDAISKFYHWWPLVSHLRVASSMGDAVKEILRELPGLNLDEAQLSKAGQAIFEARALKAGDSKLYVALRQLRQTDRNLDLSEVSAKTRAKQKELSLAQKDQEIALDQQRFRRSTCELFLEWTASEQARAIAGSGATNADKIEQLGLAMFGEDWNS